MTDLSAVITSTVQDAVVKQHVTINHLLGFTTACSQCSSLLEQTPSIRDVAFERLSSALRGKVAVWNPNIIFLNTASESGRVHSSLSLTDALVQALASGASVLDDKLKALYDRHDSVRLQHRIAEDDTATIQRIVPQVLEALHGDYLAALDSAWDSDEPSADGAQTAARYQVVSAHHHSALEHEIEFQFVEQGLTADEKNRLLRVLADQPTQGLFKIYLRSAGGMTAPLLSVFAVAQSDQATDASDIPGVWFLVMPAGGIERYASFAELNSHLARRLSGTAGHEPILQHLLLSDLDGLPDNPAVGDGDLKYEPCIEPMLHCHVLALRSKQARDFDFLVAQARANDDYQTFLKRVSDVQVCAHVDEAMGYRFKSLAVRAEENAQPAWLKHAEADKREHHTVLDNQYLKRKGVVDRLFMGLESLEAFALAEIDRYVRERLGYHVDPQKIMISLPDTFDLQDGTFSVSYRKSLLEFAMQGLPNVPGVPQLTLPPEQTNAAFTFDFVTTMLHELDLPRRYRQALRARYTDETTLRALTHLRDSKLALSVWEAQLQGHLLQERSLDLLHWVRGDSVRDGAELSLGSLNLGVNGVRFKDLLVFRDNAGNGDDHYVLYAPGAPGGRDLFEFNAWHKLAQEVGSWLRTDAGSRYVREQTATTDEPDHSDFLEKVRDKGTLWTARSVVFSQLRGQNFEERLADAILHKVERTLALDDAATLGLSTETAFANRRIVALLDHRIEALDEAFVGTTRDMVSFQAFARREGSKLINDYSRNQGFTQSVDTDTIYVDLENESYVANPDFSESTHLKSLTQLFMEGYSDQYAYTPQMPMYSSIGQDLRALPLYFVQFVDKALRSEALGERYIKWMKSEFLDPGHRRYGHRKALFGRRLQFDMRAAAMRDFLKGDLSTKQYQWLVQLIVSLDKRVLAQDPGLQKAMNRSAASVFRYAGHVVQGVYMLKDFSSSDGDFNLLYTPNAPDGVSFRKITDYVQLASSLQMRRYYYLRVSSKGQPSVGSLFDAIDRNIPMKGMNVEHLEHDSMDRVFDIHELYDTQINRIISDVDTLIESTAERWVTKVYSVVRLLGSALLLPFPGAALAWTALHTAIDIQRGLLAYHDGDRAAASWFFGSAVFGSIMGGSSVKTVLTHDNGLVVKIGWWALKKLVTRIP